MTQICVIQINVTDMDRAIEFYSQILGFRVRSREHYPDIVELENATLPFILNRVKKNAEINYPNVAQTLVNIQTSDLKKALLDLHANGVEIIHQTPQKCPVGIYAAFRDPSGNVLELIEFQ